MNRLTFLLHAAIGASLVACSSAPTETTPTSTTTSAAGGAGGTSTGSAGGGGGSGGGEALPCTDSGVSKGPWSLAIDGTSAKVRWEACRAGTNADVVFAPEAGGADTTAKATVTQVEIPNTYTAAFVPDAVDKDLAGTYYAHEAALTGLAQGTCYSYHLAADPSTKSRFCTARASGASFSFMAVGDTNPGIGPFAAGIQASILPLGPDFTIHGGDIQYYASGLETWASWFPVMQPMLSHGGFFPAIGNHEAEKDDEYELYSKRFFGNAGFDGTSEYYRFQSGGVWFFSLDTEEPLDPGGGQGAWLVAQLADAAKQPGFRFSIVYLHKPLVTCGDTSDSESSRMKLEPSFLQHKVLLVLQAHMHGYERFDFGNITYITSGGGGGALGNVDENIDRPYCDKRVASGGWRHGMHFEVGPGSLTGTAIDPEGMMLDTFTLAAP